MTRITITVGGAGALLMPVALFLAACGGGTGSGAPTASSGTSGSTASISTVPSQATGGSPDASFPVAIPSFDVSAVLSRVAPDGRVAMEPFYTVMGFAASDDGLAVLARASQKQVVNVAQHGGLCAVLVCHSRPEVGLVTAEHRAPSLPLR